MSFKKEVIEKLDKIQQNLAVNNEILKTHEQRSTDLHNRVKPLEESHIFFNKLSKAALALFSICASLAAIYHYILK